MIQFNLLPDIKKEYIKARRSKRLIISSSVFISSASIAIVLVMFSIVQVSFRNNIKDLTEDINSEVAAVKSVDGVDKILTIQNQLNEISTLHQDKPETSRIFDYLATTTPSDVFISTVTLDIELGTMEVVGGADSIASINKYADTLKFATFSSEGIEDEKPFSDVITTLNRNGDKASYTIKLSFNPILFDNTATIVMKVPSTITTRSTLGLPTFNSGNDLFKETPSPTPGGEQ